MPHKHFTDEQIAFALRQAESIAAANGSGLSMATVRDIALARETIFSTVIFIAGALFFLLRDFI